VTTAAVSAMLNGENHTANSNCCPVRECYRLMFDPLRRKHGGWGAN